MVAVTAGIAAAGGNSSRQLTREGVVQRDAQGVFVRPRVAAPAGELFRRRIVGRTDQTAGLGDGLLPRQPRRAEVGEPRPAVGGEQDVLRLDVAMKDAVPVGGREPRGDVASRRTAALASNGPRCRTRTARSGPGTYSITTKLHGPSSATSYTATTFGWLS